MRVNMTVAAMAVAQALAVLALAGCGGGSANEDSPDGFSAAADERRDATAATANITVRARATLAGNVGPRMTLRLNGTAVGTAEVRATDYQDYGFQVPAIPAGAKLDVVFNNDAMVNGQDRNLFVASITASGRTVESTAAGVTYDRGSGTQAFDGQDVLPGQRPMLWNGALRFTANPPADTAGLSPACAEFYAGKPGFALSTPHAVDAIPAMAKPARGTVYTEPTYSTTASSDTDTEGVSPVSRSASYSVPSQELIQNGQFANALASWNVEDATLVKSELRSGGKALNVGWKATQRLASTALVPGCSYTLIVKARNDRGTGSSKLSMRFKRPQYSEVFRDYSVTVDSASYQDYRVEFTAPAYAAMADFEIATNGARVIVDMASLKMRTAIPQTEPIASSEGSHVPAGYVLAFNDEFNGTRLNRAKWFTRYIYAAGTQDTLNDEKQRYRDHDNHVVADGVLSLVARKVSSTDPKGMDYESGMIRSDWTSRYGYYEARVKMPSGLGVAPAFWLNSDVSAAGRLGWPPEIDIFEFVHNGVEDRLNMLHFDVVRHPGIKSSVLYAHPAFSTNVQSYFAPYRFNEGWHTVGAQWDPTTVTLFVDGLKICTLTYQWNYGDGTLAGPAHILLNFAVGGEWAGRHGIDDTAFPQAFQIDWVRAYEKIN
jgi:beta-glucanase (GH16 family)